jgi:hypothetical protein
MDRSPCSVSRSRSTIVPLTSQAFVLSGSLGEWLFVVENGRATRILNLRKFAPLVWTRVDAAR